jgi:hypothetical protein
MKNVVALLLLTLVVTSDGQPKKKPIDKSVIKTDLPHIGCDVCMKAVSEIYRITNEAREKAPYNNLKEIDIIDTIESICKSDDPKGHWIKLQDIVEEKENGRRYLALEEPGGEAKCARECGMFKIYVCYMYLCVYIYVHKVLFIYIDGFKHILPMMYTHFWKHILRNRI